MHPDEGGLIRTGQGDVCGAMGLVTQDEIEVRQPELLCLRRHVDGLVRTEHHGKP